MKKKLIIIVSMVLVALILAAVIPFIVLAVKSTNLDDNYLYLFEDEAYASALEIEDFELITQEITCGYAVIEMISKWSGGEVSEESLLYKNNNAISTWSIKGIHKELNEAFDFAFVKYTYLKNSELIKKIYNSLEKGYPVPFSWAAEYEDEWTLHYSVIMGIDMQNDLIKIANPYGFFEEITIDEFIGRTTYRAYSKMSLFLRFGFAFGAFTKNTIFVIE